LQRAARTAAAKFVQPAGQDACDVASEFQVQERWVPGFKLHMHKVMSAKR
jgi:hypothetical protein